MNLKKIIIVTSLSLLLVSCGRGGDDGKKTAGPFEHTGARDLTLNLTLSRFDFTTNTPSDVPLPMGLTVFALLIPGEFLGRFSNETLVTASVDSNYKSSVNLTPSIFTATTKPTLLSNNALQRGLSIEPADTKIATLGIFVRTNSLFKPTSFSLYDNTIKRNFYIMYFDRAALLSGTASDTGTKYNVKVDKLGFHIVVYDATNNELRVANISDELFLYVSEVIDSVVTQFFSIGNNLFNKTCQDSICIN